MAVDLKGAWRALPEPIRRLANQTDQALGRAALPWVVSRVWRRGELGQGPVLVTGLHRAVLGLGQGARLFIQALEADGVDARALDVADSLTAPSMAALVATAADTPTESSGGTIITHLNPPELELYLQRTGARDLKGRRHIGYWAWELPVAPKSWKRAFAYVDEVWCPSSFAAAALRDLAPANVPVRIVPHPVFVLPQIQPDRGRFGLPADACVVLQAFDLRSTVARKNPFGGLDAYLEAAPESGPRARLVCKVIGANAYPSLFGQLRARLAERSDLILIADELSAADMLALTASVDIILSLHRAEGFGLLLAEGLWLGKAVVATGWSGNMDFMDAHCAALVDFTLVPANDPQGMYQGAMWADPDLHAATAKLRELIGDPLARAALGDRGRARAQASFDRAAWVARVKGFLSGSDQAANA